MNAISIIVSQNQRIVCFIQNLKTFGFSGILEMISNCFSILLIATNINSIDLFSDNPVIESEYEMCYNRTKGKPFSLRKTSHLVSESSILRLPCDNLWSVSVTLVCNPIGFHFSLNFNDSVDNVWVFQSIRSSSIALRPKKAKLLSDLSLEVKFDSADDSGTYLCVKNFTIHAIHQISVANETFALYKTDFLPPESEAQTLTDSKLQVFTDWSDWSECNRCEVGLRRRVGICKVKVRRMLSNL